MVQPDARLRMSHHMTRLGFIGSRQSEIILTEETNTIFHVKSEIMFALKEMLMPSMGCSPWSVLEARKEERSELSESSSSGPQPAVPSFIHKARQPPNQQDRYPFNVIHDLFSDYLHINSAGKKERRRH